MTSEENLADLIRSNELLAARDRRKAVELIQALTQNYSELAKLSRECQLDKDDERNGDWTR